MALAETVEGDGILVSASKSSHIYTILVDGPHDSKVPIPVKETIEREVREWPALTKSAAETEKNANVQPVGNGTYTYDIGEQLRPTVSYTLMRMFEHKVTAQVNPGQAVNVQFQPAAGEYEAGALAVTLSSETEGAEIVWWWRDDDGVVSDPAVIENVTAVNIVVPATVWAFAQLVGMKNSAVAKAIYTASAEE